MLQHLCTFPKTHLLEVCLVSIYKRFEQTDVADGIDASDPRRVCQVPKQLCTGVPKLCQHPLNENGHLRRWFETSIVNQKVAEQVRYDSHSLRAWRDEFSPLKVLKQSL